MALSDAYLMKHEVDMAVEAAQEAVRLLPNYARANLRLGYNLHWAGRGDEAIAALKTAMRLDPKPSRRLARFRSVWLGFAYVTAGRYDDANATLNRNFANKVKRGSHSLCFLAAAYVATGQDEKARAVMKAFLDKKPKTRISNYRSLRLYKRKEDRDRFANLLRKAGMSE